MGFISFSPTYRAALQFSKGENEAKEFFNLDIRSATFFIGAVKAPNNLKCSIVAPPENSMKKRCLYDPLVNTEVFADVLFRFH